MLKKILFITFPCFSLFAQSPDELYSKAMQDLKDGNLSSAISSFTSALDMDPTFAPANIGLARASVRKGDLKGARENFIAAIEAEPENKDFRSEYEQMSELVTLMSKGKRSMQSGDVEQALESFRIASEKFPQYPESVFNMGLTHFRKKEFKEAADYFNKVLEVNPEHETALTAIKNVAKNYFNNGNQSYKRGDLENAISSYRNVLNVDETFYQAHYQMGVIQSKMGDKDLAIESYQKALDVNPQFYKGYFALGLAKNSTNDTDGAIGALQTAIDIYPSYDKAYGALGDIYIGKKDYEKAKQSLNMAIAVNPNYSKGHANLGVIYSDEEKWDQAVSSLEMAVALNDRDSMSFFRLASAYNNNGNCNSAKDAARKSTGIKNRFGGAWFELGVAEWCGGKGNKIAALNAFESARNDRSWRTMAEYEIDKVKNPQKYEK